MPIWLRVVLAVAVGFVAGSVFNMSLVLSGPAVIPPPPGADMTTAEGIKAALPLLQPQHFLMPFLAHAVGTLAGAMVAARLAGERAALAAGIVGVLFLAGGIAAATLIPAPAWFIAADLLLAYLPMAALGLRLGRKVGPG